ncbi:MAG: sulfatase [Kiritimatiellales bacterium]
MFDKLFISLAGLQFVAAGAKEPAALPNVLFILADDLGWMDTAVYGSTFYETPNINRLAEQGMLFTQAYTASPLCSPTRASILTGLYPARLGLTAPNCHIGEPNFICHLPAQAPANRKVLVPVTVNRLHEKYYTLAEAFRDAGYRTAHFGKWHLGAEPYSPLEHGYEVDIPHWHGAGPAGSYIAPWKYPGKLNFTGAPGENVEDRMGSEAVRYIQQHRNEPWYLAYWAFSVHWPMGSDAGLIMKYEEKLKTMPDSAQNHPVMGAMIEVLDRNIGRMLDVLDETGQTKNTIVIFTSDNGGAHFSDAVTQKPSTSNAPLRAGKATVYEGGIRVPLIIKWPGRIDAGKQSPAPVCSVDFYPTLMELTGVKPEEPVVFDGVSFASVCYGGAPADREIFCHYPHDTPLSGGIPSSSIRVGNWKLIRNCCDNSDNTDRFELYNLADDIGEQHNRYVQHPETAEMLEIRLQQILDDTGAIIPKLNPAYVSPGSTKTAWRDSHSVYFYTGQDGIVFPADDPRILTVDVPHQPGPFTITLQLQSDQSFAGQVEPVWDTGRPAKTREILPFQYTTAGSVQTQSVITASAGELFSLWINCANATAPVYLKSVVLQSGGEEIRKWIFTN